VISDNLKQYTSEMKVNANEKPWNAIILISYMQNWHGKPW
jgi:hypothetical protein